MIFTIGYSNKSISDFINKVKEYDVSLVIDVRSKPYSRNPQFNRQYFERILTSNKLNYLYMGDCLGGLTENQNFYEAIEEVVRLSEFQNVVLTCVEKNYKDCHRYQKLTPEIEKLNVNVQHIKWEE